MRVKYLIFGSLMSVGVACSHGQKSASKPEAAAPTTQAAAPAAPAAKSETEKLEERMMCTRTTDSRLLKLDRLQPKGCRLLYPNAASEVASSSVGPAYCEQVRDRIRKNLENAGFTCAPEEKTAKAP